MDGAVNTIELALLIVLPLIVFYQRLNKSYKAYVLYIAFLYVLWFGTYALLHESCHLVGSWLTGARIKDYQLVPHFWRGDFTTGYVNSDLQNGVQGFVSPIAPYVRDMLFLGIGYLAFKGRRVTNSLLQGVVLVLLVLSPFYDLFNNYAAFLFGRENDFNAIRMSVGAVWTHAIGTLFTFTAAFTVWLIFRMTQRLPAGCPQQ